MSTVRKKLPTRTLRRRATIGAGVLAGLVLLGGCAKDAPQDTWQPAGENARKINDLQQPVFLVAGIVGLIVFGVVGYVVFKFKDRGQELPPQTHGKPWLEILLTVIPAIILIFVAVPTVSAIFDLAKTDDTECVINVTGQQWWWEYDYPAGQTCGGVEITQPIVTSGQLVMPTGTKVMLHISSRDVIHSFWIPKLNGKRDAVPGRIHTLRMEADEPGMYSGQCAEFCGLSHARMRMEAVALNSADFGTWVANELEQYARPAAGSLAATGEGVFDQQCSRCHQVNGLTRGTGADEVPVLANPDVSLVAGAAPNLTNLMTRTTFAGATFDLLTDRCKNDLLNASPAEFGAKYLAGVTPECFNEAALREWLRNPPAMKPMYVKQTADLKYRGMPDLGLTEDQIDQVVAYLLERK